MSFIHGNVVNLCFSYESHTWSRDLNTGFTLGNCLLGAVKLTKNDDLDKYEYSGFGIAFDARSQFLWLDGRWGKNFVIFGVDMSSSVHVENKKKDKLTLGEGPTKRLDDTKITTEANYSLDFTASGKRFVLGLHYNESNRFLCVNARTMYQFKS